MESGGILTGASLWIQGTVVASQGSKQKIELKVEKLVVVCVSLQITCILTTRYYEFCIKQNCDTGIAEHYFLSLILIMSDHFNKFYCAHKA